MRVWKSGLITVALILPFMPGFVTIGPLVGDGRLPAEALLALAAPAALALVSPRWPRVGATLLASALAFLILLRLGALIGPALVGREVDLIADVGHLPWGWTLVGAGFFILTAILTPAIAIAADRLRRHRVIAASVMVCGLGGFAVAILLPGRGLSAASWAAIAHQRAAWTDDATVAGSQTALEAAIGPALPPGSTLGPLAGHDLYLIFFESYGAVLLDSPSLAAEARPAIQAFGARLEAADLHLRSARIASPTYGGGSWLAHGSVDAGAWLDTQRRYDLVSGTTRLTWAGLMRANGFETIDLMPGLEFPLAHQDFWGFDRVIGADDLHYDGPWFGWFGIPDQFTLEWLAHRERAPGKPLFAQIVLVSSHLPFAPVPPKLAWGDIAHPKGRADLVQAAETGPDWTRLGPAYLASIGYDLDVLADWIPTVTANGGVVILLGDHQPPALIGAASPSRDVPIHVIARDPAILGAIAGEGFTEGAVPTGSAGTMGDLLGRFVTGLSDGER